MILLLKLFKLSLFTVSKLSLFHNGIAREEKVLLLTAETRKQRTERSTKQRAARMKEMDSFTSLRGFVMRRGGGKRRGSCRRWKG